MITCLVLILIISLDFVSSNKVSIKRCTARILGSIGCSIGLFTGTPDFSDAAINPESISRFRVGCEDLENLDKNWDSVVKDTGDNIRR
jgi:hypothetical protein